MREEMGMDLWSESDAVETADAGEWGLILVNNEAVGIREGEGPWFLTVRGLLKYRPESAAVTVDMGAVRFVHNGADVMAPGIVDADPGLQEGDWCWIRDEKNKQPLAVGKCLVPGTAMVGAKGKAVRSIHHIGDKLWEWSQ